MSVIKGTIVIILYVVGAIARMVSSDLVEYLLWPNHIWPDKFTNRKVIEVYKKCNVQ